MTFNKTLYDEILSAIVSFEKDETLHWEKNFVLRQQAIDYIEFHIIDRISALGQNIETSHPAISLTQRAHKVKRGLEDADSRMFHQLRAKISNKTGNNKLLAQWLCEYLDDNDTVSQHDLAGYDNLDVFLNGLLACPHIPVETIEREPGMIYYQKTPARIILELIKSAEFKPHDVFFDLGSGLGQVVILVNLLTAVMSKGVEFEPAFCSYAKACAAALHLKQVDIINVDARYADYSFGTVFFMYTPFEGKMLQDVLRNLSGEAKKRRLKIFTYGPCTQEVAQQNWLMNAGEIQN